MIGDLGADPTRVDLAILDGELYALDTICAIDTTNPTDWIRVECALPYSNTGGYPTDSIRSDDIDSAGEKLFGVAGGEGSGPRQCYVQKIDPGAGDLPAGYQSKTIKKPQLSVHPLDTQAGKKLSQGSGGPIERQTSDARSRRFGDRRPTPFQQRRMTR